MKRPICSPKDLLFDQMKDIRSMESQISVHLPDLAATASDDRLRNFLLRHAAETDRQHQMIVELFRKNGREAGDDKCKAIAGLIDGGTSHLASVEDSATRDLMMIAHCLRIERYEIAAYEITSLLAKQLGFEIEGRVLAGALELERGAADRLLHLQPAIFKLATVLKRSGA